ncbi:MAG: hypothetical protein V5A48_10430, partial [Salinivenus sp.]
MVARPFRSLAVLLTVLLFWAAGPFSAQAQHPTAVTSIVNAAGDTTLEVNDSGGLFAPGKLDDPANYSAPNDSIPAEGAGTRMMWYPEKAAFRAGQVNGSRWDATNVGVGSVAFGQDTEASAEGATAIGDRTKASSDGATALGSLTGAEGRGATAMGR